MVVKDTRLRGLNTNVTVISKVIVLGFVFYCIAYADSATQTFSAIASSIIQYAGWFYILSVSGILVFLLYLMVSRFGDTRLGATGEKPEFNFISWVAMLFAGGMGIGLIFWSVSEPMLLYANNPFSQGLTTKSADAAMRLTFFHWGLHPWSVFVIVALSLAYFSYRRGLPLTLRSTLYPLIGDRIYGPIGDVVDILVVTITAFGIAQSLGLGVIQMNSGLHYVFGIGQNASVQLLLVVLITALALTSVMSGVGRGIRRLSELNMLLSLALIVLMMLFGPTRHI